MFQSFIFWMRDNTRDKITELRNNNDGKTHNNVYSVVICHHDAIAGKVHKQISAGIGHQEC